VSSNFTLTTQSSSSGGTGALVAFPGADGFGAPTKGGRGGRVIYVTNLNDSGTGSLRACLEATGPRYCLFRVAGTIALQDDLKVSNPFVTIAGQTAPGEGVQIKGGHLDIRTHEVIVRYMKIRAGDEITGSNNGDRNSMFLNGLKGEVYNVVVDHCTLIWGPDTGGIEMVENVHDVTVQWSINGEGLYFSNHYEGSRESGHSKGVRIAMNNSIWPKRITMHHNLLVTSSDRNPMWSNGPELQEFVNNVVYNWQWHSARGNPRSLNFIKNMYVRGPITSYLAAIRAETSEPAIYEEGTVVDGFTTVRGGTSSAYVSTRFAPYSMRTEHMAREAYDLVVADVGANRPVRDSDDQRIINNLVQRKGNLISGVNYGLTWPTLASGTPYLDADQDGMDDNWEIQHFGNTSRGSATDSTGDFDGDGYTDLEEYLNGTNPKVYESEKGSLTFTPSSGVILTEVTIQGTNLGGVSEVAFNGTRAAFTIDSDTQIRTLVPAGATTGKISVTDDNGTIQSATDFTVIVAPAIDTFNPGSGSPGTEVIMTGSGFTGVSDVTFNGVAGTFVVDSNTQVRATVPLIATSGPIWVSNAAGNAATAADFLVLMVPSITSFNPTSGLVGSEVTLTGTRFTDAAAVRFNGTPASFTFVSDGELKATVPDGATTGKISVTNPAGTATSTADFVVILPPTISSFTPTSGPVGTSVTITGTNFSTATAVAFKGTPATAFAVNSSTQITATVPTGATTGKISVTNPAGTATSTADFVVILPPTITSFTPTSGPWGIVVTITGTSFTGTTQVAFVSKLASFTVVSDTTIRATVPSGAKTGKISVTNPAGTAVSAGTFTVTRK